MPQSVIISVHDWAKRSACAEHQHNLIFLDWNKEIYNWDIIELDDNAGNNETKPSPLNNLPAKLPGIDMETEYNYTATVTPEIAQSNAKRLQDPKTNSVLIPDGNTCISRRK